ncbi:MAG TPA: DUF4855 domain-containing protein [Firmicutes bacterium]|nr:DUF4855 domain-containing protein [Bacillota bacterium]
MDAFPGGCQAFLRGVRTAFAAGVAVTVAATVAVAVVVGSVTVAIGVTVVLGLLGSPGLPAARAAAAAPSPPAGPGDAPEAEVLVGPGVNSFSHWDRSPGWIAFNEETEDETIVYTAMGLGRAGIGDISWQDYTLAFNYKIYQYGQWGVLRVYVRYQGPYQGYGLNILPDGIQLVRFDGRWDQVQLLGYAPVRSDLNTTYHMEISVQGDGRLVVSRDHRRLFACTDPARAYTGGGISFGPEAVAVVLSGIKVTGTRIPQDTAERIALERYVRAWQERRAANPKRYPGYLSPAEVEPPGVHHIVLIYNGLYPNNQGDWTPADALPYVAYLGPDAQEALSPLSWFFDTILLLGLSTPGGGALGSSPGATLADWIWYLDKTFSPTGDLAAFEAATARAAAALGDPGHRLNVILMLPYPAPEVSSFGDIDNDGRPEGFSLEGRTQAQADADRLRALQWYIAEATRRWQANQYRHLRLVGWYWVNESIDSSDAGLVRQVSAFIHNLPPAPETATKLYWIPWFNAPGSEDPRSFGLDYTMMQPNYMFLPQVPKTRFAETAERAEKYHLGLEIESEDWVLTSAAARERYFDYLRAGKQLGFMNGVLLSYYQGVKVLAQAARSADPEVRRVYDATYLFTIGRWEETLFPAFPTEGGMH